MLEDGLELSLVLPTDPGIDTFHCGAEEVDDYFKKREWFRIDRYSPPTYCLRDSEGQMVGLVSLGFRKCGLERDTQSAQERFLVVYAVGIDTRFQGSPNPSGRGSTYAVTLFRLIERVALDAKTCVGLYLWVRSDNDRAVRFYTKLGFTADPGGPVSRDEGAQHLTMRKLLRTR